MSLDQWSGGKWWDRLGKPNEWFDTLQDSLGRKEGSSDTKKLSKISDKQREWLNKAMTGLGEGDTFTYKDYTYDKSGEPSWKRTGATDVTRSPFKGSWEDIERPELDEPDWDPGKYTADDISKIQKMEGYQSIDGLDELRRMSFKNTMDPSAQVDMLMKLAQLEKDTPYSARVADITSRAGAALSEADVLNLRQGGGGGSARLAALNRMGTKYAQTVGRESAKVVEENQFNRLNTAINALRFAGGLEVERGKGDIAMKGLELGARGQDAQYNLGRGQLEASQAMYGHGAEQQNLQYRQGLAMQDKQFAGDYGLRRGALGLQKYGTDAAFQSGLYSTDVGARSARYASDVNRYGIDTSWASGLRDVMSREGTAENQFGLDLKSLEELSKWRSAALRNQTNLGRFNAASQRWGLVGGLATAPTYQYQTTVKPGSAGLLPGLIKGGAMIAAAYAGRPDLAAGASQFDFGGSQEDANIFKTDSYYSTEMDDPGFDDDW